MTAPKKTKKPGRPKLPKGESRAKFLRVRITPDEMRAIERAAAADGIKVSEWSRRILRAAIEA